MKSMFCVLVLTTSAFAKGGSEADAKTVLEAFVKPGADAAALSAKLRPTAADYAAVFEGDAAQKAQAAYDPAWGSGKVVISGKPDQSALLVFKATTEELRSGAPAASNFPGGYKTAASFLKPGLTLFAFKFVKPGESSGMAFDGLTFVNGHWTIFPKPFRFLR